MAKKKARIRRRPTDRRQRMRRHVDFYRELGKFAGLLAFTSAAVIGQAELLGEPFRHYFTVTAIVCTAIWAYCMKPSSLSGVVAGFAKRHRRAA